MTGKLKKLKLRPWGEFFEIERFKLPNPNDDEQVFERVKTNLIYYQGNYLAVLCIFLLYVCLVHPSFFFMLGLGVAGGYALFVLRTKPIIIADQQLSQLQIVGGFAAVSFFLLLLAGGVAFLMAFLFSLLVVILHSALRQRSLKSRGATYVDGFTGSTPLGSIIKSIDEESDDEAGPIGDEENPQANAREQQLKAEQAKFRQNLLSQMRAKYLKSDTKRS